MKKRNPKRINQFLNAWGRRMALVIAIAIIAVSIHLLQSQKANPTAAYQEFETESYNQKELSEVKDTEKKPSNASIFPNFEYTADDLIIKRKESEHQKAPDLTGISSYLNSPEFKLQDLKGQVVLVDFWTYSCINCIRTQPYLNAWHETYADDGLVIVGVHTPEFEFEKVQENVLEAINSANIKYPVVQDNDYLTWRAYKNRWWPRKFLIDIDGFIRYDHIGEGAYEKTENVIRELLMERSKRFGMSVDEKRSNPQAQETTRKIGTPEIYFGYKFTRGNFGSPEGFLPEQTNHYSNPEKIQPNKAYLQGSWLNKGDYSELVSKNGSITLFYYAKNVNIVAGSENQTELEVFIDGKTISQDFDPADSLVSEERLYKIVQAPEAGAHLLKITASTPGFRIYTFTFG